MYKMTFVTMTHIGGGVFEYNSEMNTNNTEFNWTTEVKSNNQKHFCWRQISGVNIESIEKENGDKLYLYLAMWGEFGKEIPTFIRNLNGKVIYVR